MIFHKYKLIITGITKNASTSIHNLLKNKTDQYHNHLTFVEEYGCHDLDLLSSYLSLAIIRNPYDRFFSACNQIRRDNEKNKNKSLQEIIDQEIYYTELDINEAFYTQNHFICLGNKILVDKLIRYENLYEEWKNFAEEYNKTAKYKIKTVLPVSNKTENQKPWQEEFNQLTQDQLNLINNMYERDFELFNYEMIKKI
jgi:hypothetical protein